MTQPSARRGIFWMVVTGVMFVTVTALVKYTDGRVPAAQSAFLRYLLGLVFLIPMIKPIFDAHLTKRQLVLFSARGFVHTLAVICWFYAMTRIPLAEVTAMNYLGPVYVTIGAALFLGEKLALPRIAAIICALIGALIILRPGFREVDIGHIAMLFTAFGFGAGYLLAKQLSGQLGPAVIVGMLSITGDDWPCAFCLCSLGAGQFSRHRYLVWRCVFCHRWSLHHDACIRGGSGHRDAACNVPTACLGNASGGCGFWRTC
jgi:drug/metabolite transporter (DMT)-like permease